MHTHAFENFSPPQKTVILIGVGLECNFFDSVLFSAGICVKWDDCVFTKQSESECFVVEIRLHK